MHFWKYALESHSVLEAKQKSLNYDSSVINFFNSIHWTCKIIHMVSLKSESLLLGHIVHMEIRRKVIVYFDMYDTLIEL